MSAPIRPAIPEPSRTIDLEVRKVLGPMKEIIEKITGHRENITAPVPPELGPSASLSEVINAVNQLRNLLVKA